ncbi:MAG: hypothetical protein V4510_02780 [bacterium]
MHLRTCPACQNRFANDTRKKVKCPRCGRGVQRPGRGLVRAAHITGWVVGSFVLLMGMSGFSLADKCARGEMPDKGCPTTTSEFRTMAIGFSVAGGAAMAGLLASHLVRGAGRYVLAVAVGLSLVALLVVAVGPGLLSFTGVGVLLMLAFAAGLATSGGLAIGSQVTWNKAQLPPGALGAWAKPGVPPAGPRPPVRPMQRPGPPQPPRKPY